MHEAGQSVMPLQDPRRPDYTWVGVYYTNMVKIFMQGSEDARTNEKATSSTS